MEVDGRLCCVDRHIARVGAVDWLDLSPETVQTRHAPYRGCLHFGTSRPSGIVARELSVATNRRALSRSLRTWRGVRELEGSNTKNREIQRGLVETPYIVLVQERAPF